MFKNIKREIPTPGRPDQGKVKYYRTFAQKGDIPYDVILHRTGKVFTIGRLYNPRL
jgi:hypothetical protein